MADTVGVKEAIVSGLDQLDSEINTELNNTVNVD